MKNEKRYSYYDYQDKPNYSDYKDFTNFNTLPSSQKNETSEMILNQTKASLNNFLSNLKKVSTVNDFIVENKNKMVLPTMSNISRISNKRFPEESQDFADSYIKISKIYETNSKDKNKFNYSKINNISIENNNNN